MTDAHLAPVLRHLRQLAGLSGTADLPDVQLLERFTRQGDVHAFEALLGRHGPLVWRVCRRVLAQADLAEDAFQATFLVLARRARSIRKPEALASWLHGVAYRTARQARADLQRRLARERRAQRAPVADPGCEAACRELGRIIDDEVQRLPERWRAPLLLCYWAGLTNEEAARQLGWPCGTVKTRPAQARQFLHDRLTRRGVTLSAGAIATVLAPAGASASVPAVLVQTTARIATGTGAASARAAALARTGWQGLSLVRRKIGLALMLVAAVALGGLSATAVSTVTPRAAGARPTEPAAPEKGPQAQPDLAGDPLPPGAVGRLGSMRFRHANWVNSVAFAPGGKVLASASWDRSIRLWDLATGKELNRLLGHTHTVDGVVFTPDGNTLISAGGDGMVRVWDLAAGRAVRSFQAHMGSSVNCVAVSPDGKVLATGGGGNGHRTLALWDLATGKELFSPGGDTYSILALAFSPDGKALAAGSGKLGHFGLPPGAKQGVDLGGGTVRLFDVATGKLLRTLEGHENGVSGVAFAPDGRCLVSASHDSTLRFWDPVTGKQQFKVQVPSLLPPGGAQLSIDHGGLHAVAFSPDGKRLATAGADGVVRLWDAATRKEMRVLSGHAREVHAVAFAADGKALASGSWDNTIRLWEPATGKHLNPLPGHDGVVSALACSPDGKLVASAGHDRTVRVWDRTTGRELRVLRGHTDVIPSLAFSADGQRLASASWDQTVRLWDAARGDEVRRLTHPGMVTAAGFSPDGTLLAALARTRDQPSECSVHLWDPRTGRALRSIKCDPQTSGPLLFSPDGKYLAVGGYNQVVLLEMPTGKEIRHFESAWWFAFSPDGTLLAATNPDGLVHLWDSATGRARYTLGQPGEQGRPLLFSPDGRLLVRATRSQVRLWEVATGKERRLLHGHEGAVSCAVFAPDGRTLLTGGEDSSILVWDMAPKGRPAGALAAGEAQALWDDLAGTDAARADRAIATLAAAPAQALPFARRQLKPATAADPRRLTQLVAQLDSDRFDTRESATRALEEQGDLAAPLLRATLTSQPSAEVRRRVDELLQRLSGPLPASPRLRDLRAIELLERLDTSEARLLLDTLARGAAEALRTREAQAALERLDRRAAARPRVK